MVLHEKLQSLNYRTIKDILQKTGWRFVLFFLISTMIIVPPLIDAIIPEPEYEQVRVALFDTGISKDHPMREIADVHDYSFIDSEKYSDYPRSLPADEVGNGHGNLITTVFLEHIEMFPDRHLTYYNFRITDGAGRISDKALIDAVEFAVNETDLDIAMFSLGGWYLDNDLETIVNTLTENNVLPVVSAGNRGLDDEVYNLIETPAVFPDTLTVGSEFEGAVEDFSSRGITPLRNMKPDVVISHNDTITRFGTSFSVPAVGGILYDLVVFIRDRYGFDPTAGMLKLLIMEGAIKLSSEEIRAQGAGVPNYDNTLALMSDLFSRFPTDNIFSVYPKDIPFVEDLVWEGIPYYFNITVTHGEIITPEKVMDVDVTYEGKGNVEITHRYHSKYTSMLQVTLPDPTIDTKGIITVSKGTVNQQVRIDPLVRKADHIIHFNSSLSNWMIDRNRYGQFWKLFTYLAQKNIALVDDPTYDRANATWMVDPYSGEYDPSWTGEFVDDHKRVFGMFATMHKVGWKEFRDRGWVNTSTVVSNNVNSLDVTFLNETYTVPFFGHSLIPTENATGQPLRIDGGGLDGRAIGLLDGHFLSFLSNFPFDSFAFIDQYGDKENALLFIDAIVEWLIQ